MPNLFVQNTGLEHLYVNGVPIIEAEIDMDEVYAEVRRITGLAALADPYLLKLPIEVRKMVQLQGDERIAYDMIKRCGGDILPVFQCKQRWIPEGVYGGKNVDVDVSGINGDYTYTPNGNVEAVKEANMYHTGGFGFVSVVANGTELGTFDLSDNSKSGQEGLRGANQDIEQIEFLAAKLSEEVYLPSVEDYEIIQDQLDTEGIGNFTGGQYWASDEVNSTDAYVWDFMEALDDVADKSSLKNIRIARKIANVDYVVGSLIEFEGENYFVFKVENTVAHCVKENDEVATATWADGMAAAAELRVNFTYDLNIPTIERDGISWRQSLTEIGDVIFPRKDEVLTVYNLCKDHTYTNWNDLKIYEVTLKHESGSADVDVSVNGVILGTTYNLSDGERNDDLRGSYDDIQNVSVVITNATEDFKYSLILNIGVLDRLPSPRYEFDSVWHPNKIIFRYQNMDTRIDKLDYTPNTYADEVIDPANFDNVKKYLFDAFVNYILKELYRTVGYDKKYADYNRAYENNRRDVAYWVKNMSNLQTTYHNV